MHTFLSLDFYLLRSPRLPIITLVELSVLKTKKDQEQFFRKLYSEIEMQEAILLASPDLYAEMQRWLAGKILANDKLLNTLYKYTARMSSRCTPFGHFAGISTGKIVPQAEKATIHRNGEDTIKYRLDMQCVAALAQKISVDPDIRSQLIYFLNSTIYRQGDQYKFYQSRNHLGSPQHFLSAVSLTTPIEYILSAARDGISHQELVENICAKGAPIKQAILFINQLIENQILVSELQPTVTGADYLSVLKTKLEKMDKKKRYLPTIIKIDKLLGSDYILPKRQASPTN